jgi:hypothetical protein
MALTSRLTFSCGLRVRVVVSPRSEHRRLLLACGERGVVAKNDAVRLGSDTEQRGSAATEAVSRRLAREEKGASFLLARPPWSLGTRVARSRCVRIGPR